MLRTRDHGQGTDAEASVDPGLVRMISQSLNDAVALSDERGVVLAVNPAYTRLYGFTESQVVGQSFALIFPEAQQNHAKAAYGRAFRDAAPPVFVANVQSASGTERRVESRIAFVYRGDTRVAMLSVIRDLAGARDARPTDRRAPMGLNISSLESLYDAHARSSIGYAHALLGDVAQAERVVEDALLAVWRAGVSGEENHSVARLLLLSVLRRLAGEVWVAHNRDSPAGTDHAQSVARWWTSVPS